MDEARSDTTKGLSRDHVLTLHGLVAEEIERTKQWGTQLVLWTIAGQGGLLALAAQRRCPDVYDKAMFSVLVAGLTVAAACLLCRNDHSLKRARRRKTRVLRQVSLLHHLIGPESSRRKAKWRQWQLVVISGFMFCVLICRL